MDNQLSTISNAIQSSNKALQASNESINMLLEYIKGLEQKIENNERVTENQIAELQKKQNHISEMKDGFVGLAGLGAAFNPSIGAQYMGKFLRKIGVARKNDNGTYPVREYLLGKNKLADSKAGESFTVYHWHLERTVNYIDNWLIKKGLYQKFSSITTIEEMNDFINNF